MYVVNRNVDDSWIRNVGLCHCIIFQPVSFTLDLIHEGVFLYLVQSWRNLVKILEAAAKNYQVRAVTNNQIYAPSN